MRPADLDGGPLGAAFVKCVIKDPRVQAFGEWLCLEYPEFQSLFRDGLFPTPGAKSPYGPFVVVGGDKWPVVLEGADLAWDFARVASRGECHEYQPAPEAKSNSFFHTGLAIADRAKAFFGLLVGNELTVSGYSEDLTSKAIPKNQWTRPDCYLDVRLSDLLSIAPESNPRRLLTGVTATALDLRAEINRSIELHRMAVDEGLLSWLKEKRKFGERVSQAELEQRIDPGWLRAHQIIDGEYIPKLLSEIAEGRWTPFPPQRSSVEVPFRQWASNATTPTGHPTGDLEGPELDEAIRRALKMVEDQLGGKKITGKDHVIRANVFLRTWNVTLKKGNKASRDRGTLKEIVEQICDKEFRHLRNPRYLRASGR